MGLDPRPFSFRELYWMAAGKTEAAGEVVAGLAELIPLAVWSPGELAKLAKRNALNPFRDAPPESDAMIAYKAARSARRLAADIGGLHAT